MNTGKRVFFYTRCVKNHEWVTRFAVENPKYTAEQLLNRLSPQEIGQLVTFHGFTRHRLKSVNITTLVMNVKEYRCDS